MTDFDLLLGNRIWLVLPIWAIVYTLDYYLTIIGARYYHSGANQHFRYEGSYELTPVFQQDIDARRLISPRFTGYLILSCVLIFLVWFLDTRYVAAFTGLSLFSFLMGALFLREAAVFLRHIRNISLFRYAQNAGDVQGKVEYPRWLTLKVSAIELLSFSVFFLLLFFLFGSLFLLGGTLSCLVTGGQHWRLAGETVKQRHV